MKELEQEKDSLLAGLDIIERAREWYQNQIQNVAEKQRQMGQANPSTVNMFLILLLATKLSKPPQVNLKIMALNGRAN